MSKLQKFVKDNYGTQLLPIQIKMIEAWADNKTIFLPKASGKTFVNKVIRDYIKQSLAPPPKNKEQ